MIKVELKNKKGGVVAEIKLPGSAAELPLANYVSFITDAEKVGMPGRNSVLCMAKAVAEFSGQPVDKIMQAQFGDDWDSAKDVGQIEGIKALYGWCLDVVGKWKGELRTEKDHCFEFGGKRLRVPLIFTQAIGGAELPPLDVNEAVEVFETVRMFGDEIAKGATVRECVGLLRMLRDEKEREPYEVRLHAIAPESKAADLTDHDVLDGILEKHGDENGNMAYSRYLTMLAILCREDGETLPENESKRRAFIRERAAFFQGIDTKTALDVDFFLLATLKSYGLTLPVPGSLIRPVFGHVVETKRWSARHTQGR